MSVTELHGNASNEILSTRREKNVLKVVPEWTKVTLDQWLEHLKRLVDSYITPKDRLYWMLTMREWLATKLQFTDKDIKNNKVYDLMSEKELLIFNDVLQLMCEVSYKLCDWPFIIQINEHRKRMRIAQLDDEAGVVQYLQFAVAYWQMGQLESAEALLLKRIETTSSDSPLADFCLHVRHDIERMKFALSARQSDDLLLIPLEEQHLSGFSWVYHDPQIAQLCNLPDFGNDDQWFDWLAVDQNNTNKNVFSVIHESWGFIGSVSIEIHEGVGFFYYWLGQDFQGGGLGPQSVLLLLNLAEQQLGMTCCYAKLFQHNFASQKAMKKMAFQALPFEVVSSGDEQVYYYRGPNKPILALGDELIKLAAITDQGCKICV
jgi:RimJ/RimL family protein N-acetyltransferase